MLENERCVLSLHFSFEDLLSGRPPAFDLSCEVTFVHLMRTHTKYDTADQRTYLGFRDHRCTGRADGGRGGVVCCLWGRRVRGAKCHCVLRALRPGCASAVLPCV